MEDDSHIRQKNRSTNRAAESEAAHSEIGSDVDDSYTRQENGATIVKASHSVDGSDVAESMDDHEDAEGILDDAADADGDVGLRIRWSRDKEHTPIAIIEQVVPWSPAMWEGTIRNGDVLTSVNGRSMRSEGDEKYLVGPVGSKIYLTVLRPRRGMRVEYQFLADLEGPFWTKPLTRETTYRNRSYGIPRRPWPNPDKIQKRSLLFCGYQWRLRRFCIALQENRAWQALCLACITTNIAMLTLNDPLEIRYNQSNPLIHTLADVDLALTAFFVLEALVKIIAHGFAYGHLAYLDNWLNRIDFLVVLCSVADVCIYSLRHSTLPLIDTSVRPPYEYSTFVTSVKAMRSFRSRAAASARGTAPAARISGFDPPLFHARPAGGSRGRAGYATGLCQPPPPNTHKTPTPPHSPHARL
jgi:hypothetical protein